MAKQTDFAEKARKASAEKGIKCPKCGYLPNMLGDTCIKCNTPLEKLCGECGFANNVEKNYCGHCGAVLTLQPPPRREDPPLPPPPQPKKRLNSTMCANFIVPNTTATTISPL